MEKVEFLILRNLLYNEEYTRKVIPFIKSEYFEDQNQKIVFEEILKFIQEYNQLSTKEVLLIEVEKRNDVNESSFKELIHLINCLDDVPVEYNWLVKKTEEWCHTARCHRDRERRFFPKRFCDLPQSISHDSLLCHFHNCRTSQL